MLRLGLAGLDPRHPFAAQPAAQALRPAGQTSTWHSSHHQVDPPLRHIALDLLPQHLRVAIHQGLMPPGRDVRLQACERERLALIEAEIGTQPALAGAPLLGDVRALATGASATCSPSVRSWPTNCVPMPRAAKARPRARVSARS